MRVSKRNLHFPRHNILISHGHITPFVFVFLLKAYFFVLFIKASLRGVTPIPLSLFSLLFMLLCVKRLWKQGHRSIIYVAVEIFNTSEAAVCTNILKSNCVFTSEEQKHSIHCIWLRSYKEINKYNNHVYDFYNYTQQMAPHRTEFAYTAIGDAMQKSEFNNKAMIHVTFNLFFCHGP